MRRRDLIAAIAGSGVGLTRVARAQHSSLPLVVMLGVVPENAFPYFTEFKQGLADVGFELGRNAAFAWRWDKIENYPALAKDVVASRPSVIVSLAGTATIFAVRNASNTIPIVSVLNEDPVKLGLVASWNRPGGNVTGVLTLAVTLLQKQIEALSELLPPGASIGLILNPDEIPTEIEDAARTASSILHRAVIMGPVSRVEDFEAAVKSLLGQGVAGLVIPSGAWFNPMHSQLAAIVAKYRVPAIYAQGDLAASGGLMEYGIRYPDMFRQFGTFAGKILAGAKPADMPIEQPSRIELVINLKTAKALGLTIPLPLLGRADRVIE